MSFEIKHMIIDNERDGEEHVTVYFHNNETDYCITFNKDDLEIVNKWVFKGETSLPADLPINLIESIKEDVKRNMM